MILKNWVQCGNCDKLLGFRLGSEPMGSVYCHGCEPVVMHREEIREAELKYYREAAGRS
jgi:hypothetical protein